MYLCTCVTWNYVMFLYFLMYDCITLDHHGTHRTSPLGGWSPRCGQWCRGSLGMELSALTLKYWANWSESDYEEECFVPWHVNRCPKDGLMWRTHDPFSWLMRLIAACYSCLLIWSWFHFWTWIKEKLEDPMNVSVRTGSTPPTTAWGCYAQLREGWKLSSTRGPHGDG